MSITKTFSRDMGRLAIDPDQAGLVAGYDMVPDGVTLEDKSGNGNHGVISGAAFEYTEIGPSMKSDESKITSISCGDGFRSLQDLTLSFWMHPGEIASTSWIMNYFQLFTDAWGIALRAVGGGECEISINDDIDNAGAFLYPTNILEKVTHHIVVQMDSLENKMWINNQLVGSGTLSSDYWDSFLGDLFMLNRAGGTTASSAKTNISNVKVLNRVWTPAEIQAEYQAGAKATNWKSDYGVDVSIAAESTPGELSNSVARIESGSHIMTTDTINGKTCKVIECVTAGVVQIPTAYFHGNDTQAAHGGFEWWMLKAVSGTTLPTVAFIGNQNTLLSDPGFNGYSFQFQDFERVRLQKITAGVAVSLQFTAAGYVAVNVWNKIKITRSANGEFTTYLNDALLDLTGGSGTNPITDTDFTTSKYVVMELDAGDKIAWAAPNGECAITKYQGVV